MTTHLEATATLTNDKVQFTGVAGENPAVTFDYYPPLGDGQGYTPLQMVLMSLAVCSGTAIVALLRKRGKTVAGFTAQASGVRREVHPTSFATITLAFAVHSPDVADEDMRQAIQISEQSICPVWAMLKPGVEITSTYEIVAAAGV